MFAAQTEGQLPSCQYGLDGPITLSDGLANAYQWFLITQNTARQWHFHKVDNSPCGTS